MWTRGNRLGSRQSAVDRRQSQSSVRVFSHESQSAVRVGSQSRQSQPLDAERTVDLWLTGDSDCRLGLVTEDSD